MRLLLAVFLVAAGGLLLLEHRAHLLGVWPLLLVLVVCLAAHFFLHRRSDHGAGREH